MKTRTVLFQVFMLGVVLSLAIGTGQASVWAPFGGHEYQAVKVDGGVDFWSAEAMAEGMGGYIACPTSTAENLFVRGLVDDSYWVASWIGPWIGAYQLPGSGEPAVDWNWVSGEPWGIYNGVSDPAMGWFKYPGQAPDDGSGYWADEDNATYFQIQPPSDPWYAGWNDLGEQYTGSPHHDKPLGFVVERAIVPEPASLMALGLGLVGIIMRRRKAI